MQYMSMHFKNEDYHGEQIILEPEDWTEEQYKAFMDIFGLEEAERIVINEFKIEAYATPKLNPADWDIAYDHLNMVIAEYANGIYMDEIALEGVLLPLKRRYDTGERTRRLYESIMAFN